MKDQQGATAMIVAASLVPVTIAALGAVDVARFSTAKMQLQDALDAGALAAARTGSNDATTLQAAGKRVFDQNLRMESDFKVNAATFKSAANGAVVGQASATVTPFVAGLVTGGPVTVSATAEVVRANAILEIAMVLDNTGSMNSSLGWGQDKKIAYLRTAAANFVDTMAKAANQSATPNAVQISLVPFANLVNVGSSYKSESWIDQAGVSPFNDQIFTTAQGVTQHGDRFKLFANLGTSWGGCVEMRQAPYDVQDTPPTTATPATLFTPFFAPDEYDGDGGNDYVKDPKKDANGNTITDWWRKQGDIAKYSNSPKTTLDTNTGPNAGCVMQPIHRLTTDFASLKTSIGQMAPGGETNIPLGLVWGWHTLSPSAPFADGVPYGTENHKKIVVLMTDGQNTMKTDSNNRNNSHASAVGYVWQGRLRKADDSGPLNSLTSTDDDRTAAMDARLKVLCSNMKSAAYDVEIYAVGVGVTSASAALLKSCASGADHYFDVSSGAGIDTSFQNIANQIARLHLSK
jgi:Flp pilus assembly protein TadG